MFLSAPDIIVRTAILSVAWVVGLIVVIFLQRS
jgi:hypothetical protein